MLVHEDCSVILRLLPLKESRGEVRSRKREGAISNLDSIRTSAATHIELRCVYLLIGRISLHQILQGMVRHVVSQVVVVDLGLVCLIHVCWTAQWHTTVVRLTDFDQGV